MRSQIVPAMNLGIDNTPDCVVCGNCWKKFSESPNAQTENTKYINMDSERTKPTVPQNNKKQAVVYQ